MRHGAGIAIDEEPLNHTSAIRIRLLHSTSCDDGHSPTSTKCLSTLVSSISFRRPHNYYVCGPLGLGALGVGSVAISFVTTNGKTCFALLSFSLAVSSERANNPEVRYSIRDTTPSNPQRSPCPASCPLTRSRARLCPPVLLASCCAGARVRRPDRNRVAERCHSSLPRRV